MNRAVFAFPSFFAGTDARFEVTHTSVVAVIFAESLGAIHAEITIQADTLSFNEITKTIIGTVVHASTFLVFTNGTEIIGITLAKPLVTGSVIAAVFVAVSRGTLSVGIRRNTNTLSGLEITKPVAAAVARTRQERAGDIVIGFNFIDFVKKLLCFFLEFFFLFIKLFFSLGFDLLDHFVDFFLREVFLLSFQLSLFDFHFGDFFMRLFFSGYIFFENLFFFVLR